jgi:hypothetical protein
MDPLCESESNLSPYNYVANNPVNFTDPFGLYMAQDPIAEGEGGPGPSGWPWGDEIPFGAFTSNNIGRYYHGWTRNVGPSFEEYMFSKGYYYGINQYGIGTWISGDDITVYTGSSYYLGGILDAALSGDIAGIEAFVEDYWTGFYDLLANSSSLGEYGSGYGMMFDGDPKLKPGGMSYDFTFALVSVGYTFEIGIINDAFGNASPFVTFGPARGLEWSIAQNLLFIKSDNFKLNDWKGTSYTANLNLLKFGSFGRSGNSRSSYPADIWPYSYSVNRYGFGFGLGFSWSRTTTRFINNIPSLPENTWNRRW